MLKLERLNKSFGSLKAISDVSLHIEEGEIVGIIGPNGAGKTTLFNLITGIIKQDSGKVIFRGEDIGHLKTYQKIEKGIARTFQFGKSFSSMKVLSHVKIAMLGNKLESRAQIDSEDEAIRITNVVGLGEDISKFPTELTIDKLRKLELAMAMAIRARLLMIDEMFAGLTYKESEEIINIVKKMMKEEKRPTAVLVIEHNLSALKNIAHRVIVLNLGQIIAEGSFEEICLNEQVRKAYLGEYV